MQIRNTAVEATHPWPEGTFIQGGAHGVVVVRSDPVTSYETAFVEVSTHGTFLRGEGKTIRAAEDDVWTKYQTLIGCDPHGPFEARSYENGAGYCTKCGTWFPGVLPLAPRVEAADTAFHNALDRYGRDAALYSRFVRDLIDEDAAFILALMEGRPAPATPLHELPADDLVRKITEDGRLKLGDLFARLGQ